MPVIIKLYEQWVEICVKIQGVFFRSTRADTSLFKGLGGILQEARYLLAMIFYEIFNYIWLEQ